MLLSELPRVGRISAHDSTWRSLQEPREVSNDLSNDYDRSINPLWSPSPQRKGTVDNKYDSDSPVVSDTHLPDLC